MLWFTFWIRLELISFKIEQNESTSDWLAHSDFKKKKYRKEMCLRMDFRQKKKSKTCLQDQLRARTRLCVCLTTWWCLNNVHNDVWRVVIHFFYMFFQLVQIGPDRSRGFPDLTKRSQTVLKLTWTLDTSFQHLIRTHWRSTCPLQTRLLPNYRKSVLF